MKHSITKLSSLLLLLFATLIPVTAQSDDLQILHIGAETIECDGVGLQTCLQVKLSADEEWELLYTNNVNFQHELGVEYTLLVHKTDIDPDVADAPLFRYELVQVLKRTIVDGELPTFSSYYTATGDYLILTVASETAECVGMMPMDCLQIRTTSDDEWQFYFSDILDFAYEAGFEYTLVVQKADLTEENLADVPSFVYQLEQIIRKTSADTGMEIAMMLEGTAWTLRGYQVDDAFGALVDGTQITLEFNKDGIAGSAGCNSYFGSYQQDDNQLTFGTIGSTRMACEGTIMQQETSYFEALESASLFTTDGETLKIQIGAETYMLFDPMVMES